MKRKLNFALYCFETTIFDTLNINKVELKKNIIKDLHSAQCISLSPFNCHYYISTIDRSCR